MSAPYVVTEPDWIYDTILSRHRTWEGARKAAARLRRGGRSPVVARP